MNHVRLPGGRAVISRGRNPIAPLAAALAAAIAPTASADRVLDRYAPSLTAYRASAATPTQGVRPNVAHRAVQIDGSPNWPTVSASTAPGGGGVLVPGSGLHLGELFGGLVTEPDPGVPSCGPDLPKHIGEMRPPQGGGGAPQPALGGIDLATGSWRVEEVDLALPAPGFPWRVGRSYGGAQVASGGSALDSDGFQGRDWFQSSAPEIVFQDEADDATDMVYVVWGAAAYTEFVRNASGVNVFKSKNGANAAIEYAAGSPDTWTLTTPDGVQAVFFGGNTAGGAANWQLWKIADPAGNVAYAGHATSASSAASAGYSGGRITTAYDTADRRYTYTYTTLDSVPRLTQVKAETRTGGTWSSPTGVTEVARVDYSYYVSTDSDIANGTAGDLKLVKVTLPLTDAGATRESRRYFRYWKGSWASGTNPGQAHLVMHALDSEGCRRYSLSDATLFAATDAQIRTYARASFEYDSSRRVSKTWSYGACGCGSAANGASEISYGSNGSYSDGSGYDVAWKSRAVIERPDGLWTTQYVDECGQGLSRVVTPTDPASSTSTQWSTYVSRDHPSDADLDGLVQEISQPDNVTAYVHSTASFTRSAAAGVVRAVTRETSGDRKGLEIDVRRSSAGTGGTRYLDSSRTFVSSDPSLSVGTGSGSSVITLKRPMPATSVAYSEAVTSGTTGARETSFSYAFWSGSAATRPKTVTATLPGVSVGNNGPGTGSPADAAAYLRTDGTLAFARAPDGTYAYTLYANGQLAKRIDDCVLNSGTDFAAGDDPSGDFGIAETGAGLRQITAWDHDAQGRVDAVTMHANGTTDAERIVRKSYYTKLADGKDLTLTYADYVGGATPTYYGPISFALTNHAGGSEAQGTIAVSQSGVTTALASQVDETQTDLVAAIDVGTVARLSTSVFDASGHQRTESRAYFAVPSSLPGTEGTHYDATRYAYDDASRLVRTKTADGTITRTYFDSDQRPYRTKVGTNDNGEASGEPSGTNDMTTVSELVYDSVGRVTESRAFHGTGSGDYRATTYAHDAEGRVTLTVPPAAPYSVRKYDHMGRTVAEGLYSSTSGLSATTDPTATTSANRIALSETEYDERGRAWKTTRWEINQSSGAKGSSLLATRWFDAAGREIKSDGEQLTKTAYDRLGRQTRRFTLAKDDDSGYSDADDVTGDTVLEEDQTVYDPVDGNVLMTVSIQRRHDDYGSGETTGALDTGADGSETTVTASDLKGRASITAMWYDGLDRMTATAAYGTNQGSTFTLPSGAPSRPPSGGELLTSTAYDDDGSVLETTDPRGKKRRTLHDALGRTTATISNYVDGTPSSPTGDDDVYVRQSYANGLRTKYWVDVDGDGVEDSGVDQVTTYSYGVSKGTSAGDSKIAAGNLLQKVTYPDSTGGSDVVTYAYDTSRAQIWRKDQAGTVVETSYDSGGRREHERVTTFGSGVDQAVKRITYAFDAHGRVETTTTYDDATVGSGAVVNQVKSAWDAWGNLTSFKVDPDSAVGASGGVPTKEVSYTYATATTGRNTIRRSGITLPGSWTLTYVYPTGSSGKYAGEASRVANVQNSSHLHLVDYEYLGVGDVVGVDYGEPDVFQHRYGSTSGTWPDLDRFGRVIHSRWTKDLATDIDLFSLDVTYDENSNPIATKDNVFPGYDVAYAVDGLDRLTDADEGTLSGTSIQSGTRTRRQQWTTLSQTGNWDRSKLDLDGNGSYTGTNEHDDSRTHNLANEILTRDVNSDSSVDYTLTHDAAGNLTDDGKDYAYVYDAWYRLRQIKNRTSGAVVSEHQYYGNGFRAGERYDSDASGTVDSSDKWFWFAYDERWRILGTYRDADSSPKERFLHHTAGLGGYGGSSYIDDVVLRERDANTDWNGTASDGTLEERLYCCQNWRHDVVALVTSGGAIKERAKYFSYGIPFGIPLGDCDGDGDVDSADQSILLGAWGTSTVRCDLNLDGTVNASDQSIQSGEYGATSGWEKLSRCRNRLGYAGYCADMAVGADWHVRNRALATPLGRWFQRDWVTYVDGSNLYHYLRGSPIWTSDAGGLSPSIVFSPATANANWIGSCGSFKCSADWLVSNGATPTFQPYSVVAHVERTVAMTCCPGINPPTASDTDGFYEDWGVVPPLRPWEIWRHPTDAEHHLSDGERRFCQLTDHRWVNDVRLIDVQLSSAWFGSGQPALVWYPLCDQEWDWQTNPNVSEDPPLGWDHPYGVNVNTHDTNTSFGSCCGPVRTVGTGTCRPGPDYN
ncbi:MAG: RHS repeat-associated core domain-containing protein [Phycisphaerales bacterium]